MAPVSDLTVLLQSMAPALHEGTYAYALLPEDHDLRLSEVVAMIREREGTSVIVEEETLGKRGLTALFRCAWITLTVHSDLQAVGLTAAFSRALADAGISCNVVAGAHHDHLFVPVEQATRAMTALSDLQRGASLGEATERCEAHRLERRTDGERP